MATSAQFCYTTTMSTFANFTALFEASVNWPKRLAHEEPFYRDLFQRHHVQSLLDAACGPGRHAGMFHSWGLRVQGADLSPAMIARAQETLGEPADLSWVVRDYTQPVPHSFDAVICVGNSLALAADPSTATRAVQQMMAAAQKVLVIHLANMWTWPDGPCLWQKCLPVELPEGPAVMLKGVHRSGPHPFIEMLLISGQPPKLRSDSVALLGLEASALEHALRAAGASRVTCFGGYRGEPYDRATSVDLILVAER